MWKKRIPHNSQCVTKFPSRLWLWLYKESYAIPHLPHQIYLLINNKAFAFPKSPGRLEVKHLCVYSEIKQALVAFADQQLQDQPQEEKFCEIYNWKAHLQAFVDHLVEFNRKLCLPHRILCWHFPLHLGLFLSGISPYILLTLRFPG